MVAMALLEEGSVDVVPIGVEHQRHQQDKAYGLDIGHRLVAKRLPTDHLDDDE